MLFDNKKGTSIGIPFPAYDIDPLVLQGMSFGRKCQVSDLHQTGFLIAIRQLPERNLSTFCD
jgi:hypothetical protein